MIYLKKREKGLAASLEAIVIIGGITAAGIFLMAQFDVISYLMSVNCKNEQRDALNDLGLQLDNLNAVKSTDASRNFEMKFQNYSLRIEDGNLRLKSQGCQETVSSLSYPIENNTIEDRSFICLKKESGILKIKAGNCS